MISSEQREASGHADDLHYLLSLYLIGPSSDELVSPLPWGTRLLGVSRENGTVTLELTDTACLLPMHQWEQFSFTQDFLAACPAFAGQVRMVERNGQCFTL